MRRLARTVAVTVLVMAGLGACGNGDDAGSGGQDAGGRVRLPIGAGGGSASAVMSAGVESDAAGDAKAMLAPARAVEYRLADGAKAPATKAPAYRVVRDGDVDKADVAKALGVDEDGVGELVAGLGFFYSNPNQSVSSGVAVACAPDGADCPQPERPAPPPGVPSATEAERRLREILDALDVDTSDGRFESDDDGEVFVTRMARFLPTVDGLEVQGLESAVAFGANGRVEFANGFLGRFEKVGDYPLIGLAEAVDRFEQGFGGGVQTMTAEDAIGDPAVTSGGVPVDGGGVDGSSSGAGQTEPESPGCAPDEKCAVPPSPPDDEPTVTIEPQPTTPTVPLEPEIVEITGAEMALEVVFPMCEDGDIYVVPSYRLLPQDVVGATVLAVDEGSLVVPDPEAPAEPCPGQSEPDVPVGKPEPAPMPPDAGQEPARP